MDYCSFFYMQERPSAESNQPTFNIVSAWEANYTGKGILVAVVDDGVDGSHPELTNNYVTTLSLFLISNYHCMVTFKKKNVV